MQNRLGIFAKHWTPGQVKTRLGTVGVNKACQIYFRMLSYLIEELRSVADQRTIVFAPPHQVEEFRKLSAGCWELAAQSEGDLGARMRSFFEAQFGSDARLSRKETYPNLIVIGADCPAIDRELIDIAFGRLTRASVVMGPSHDGGYYLLGMNQPHWEVFESIDWSTDKVLTQTLDRLAGNGVAVELLPTLSDVDTGQDLHELIADWSGDPKLSPERQRLLKELQRILTMEEPA